MGWITRVKNGFFALFKQGRLSHIKSFADLSIILLLTAVFAWAFNALNMGQVLENVELAFFDLRVSLAADHQVQKPSKDIVLVVFDDDTLAEFEHIYGAWPWSRQVHADIIRYLNQASVKLMAFDIMFVGKGKDDRDTSLINAYLNSPNVYLGYNLTYGIPDTLKNRLKPLPGVRVEPFQTLANQGIDWSLFNNTMLNFKGYRPLLPGLMQNPDRLGVINHLRDRDGVSRGNPLIYKVLMPNGKSFTTQFMPYLGLKILLDLKGFDWQRDYLVVTPNNHVRWKDLDVPLRNDGQMYVNWLSTQPKPYAEIPARYILESIARLKANHSTTFDRQLMAFLKHKIVFIGATSVSTFDIKTTAIQRMLPGVTYQATMFDNLLNSRRFLRRLDTTYNILIAGALCILGCFCLIRIRSALVAYTVVVLLALAYFAVTQLLLMQLQLWLDLAHPMLMYAAMVIITFTVKYMSRELDYRKTYKLATTDSLTGLYNHRYFMEQANQLIERCHDTKSRFSVILVDIDHFKKFNDTYGHLIGDAVLRAVAQTLKQHVRSIDIVCRYGGEEMAILLARTNLDEALQVANKLVQIIGTTKHNLGPGVTRQVTISAGVSSYTQHGHTITDLIEHADKGLYLAKDGGRNQVGLAVHRAVGQADAAQTTPLKPQSA